MGGGSTPPSGTRINIYNRTMKNKNILYITIATVLILLIPFVGTTLNRFGISTGWSWQFGDYIMMGTLLFGTGLVLDLIDRNFKKPVYRIALFVIAIMALITIWAQLAVGAVSQVLGIFF